jgi:hypothetical protein
MTKTPASIGHARASYYTAGECYLIDRLFFEKRRGAAVLGLWKWNADPVIEWQPEAFLLASVAGYCIQRESGNNERVKMLVERNCVLWDFLSVEAHAPDCAKAFPNRVDCENRRTTRGHHVRKLRYEECSGSGEIGCFGNDGEQLCKPLSG